MRHVRCAAVPLIAIAWFFVGAIPSFGSPQQAPQPPPAQTTQQTTPQTTQQTTPQAAAAAQTAAATQPASADSYKCRDAADPHRRQSDCNDQGFDWDLTLSHRWKDLRKELNKVGVTPTASYLGVLQTNVTGGTHEIWTYAGQLSFGLNADMEKILRISGLTAYVGATWGTGGNLAGSLNSEIPTTGLYAPSFYLGALYLQQKLLDEKLMLRGGRLAASTSFAALPVFTNYVTYGINPNPYSFGANDVTFFGPPAGTEWGAQGSYFIRPSVRVQAGAFNTNVHSANGENHGADFILQEGNKGLLAIGEADYSWNQDPKSRGKPGQLGAGILHNNNSFPLLNNPTTRSDGYSGVYVMGQQMIYRPGDPGTAQGATVWGIFTHNSKDTINALPSFAGAGVSYQGLLPGRKSDVASAGVVYGGASKFAPAASSQEFFELNYQWSITPAVTLCPHLQRIWNQGTANSRDATVLGIQLAVTF